MQAILSPHFVTRLTPSSGWDQPPSALKGALESALGEREVLRVRLEHEFEAAKAAFEAAWARGHAGRHPGGGGGAGSGAASPVLGSALLSRPM